MRKGLLSAVLRSCPLGGAFPLREVEAPLAPPWVLNAGMTVLPAVRSEQQPR